MLRKIVKFLKEVRLEMQRVTWPTRRELSGATWVVIVAVVIIALFIGIVDQVLMRFIGLVLK